jgi:hypothetical protein
MRHGGPYSFRASEVAFRSSVCFITSSYISVRFEIFTLVKINILVTMVVIPCSLVICANISEHILKLESVCSYEMLVLDY